MFIGFKFLQNKTLYIGDMLAETVVFCVFNGQDTEQLPFQFGNQVFVFDDVVLVVAPYMDSVYVFICNGYCIADKKMDFEEVRPI